MFLAKTQRRKGLRFFFASFFARRSQFLVPKFYLGTRFLAKLHFATRGWPACFSDFQRTCLQTKPRSAMELPLQGRAQMEFGHERERRCRSFFASSCLCASLFFLAFHVQAADPDAAATVVVFNEQDAASVDLAGYYAEKRGIPFDHLIALTCSMEETVSRADYDRTIAEPLRKAFLSRGGWKTEADIKGARVAESTIRYVALMRGVPLRIAAVAAAEGDRPLAGSSPLNHNEAAVDSELAVLGMQTRQISGPLENPVFRKPEAQIPWLLRVCRLDAAEPATVRRMIDDSLAAEKSGLWGFAYIDSRGISNGPMGEGDQWFRNAAADAVAHGIPCIPDTAPDVFPEHYPMTRMALYFGWYSGEVEGAFLDPTLRFLPGAVAVHLHSFSATSLRAPLRGWCAPLLERGAAATLGNVYEPYLMLTPHLDWFEARLRAGDNFAQAAYGSQSALSWMTTFIGDPLYRPFKAWQAPGSKPVDYAAYREGAECWAAKGRAAGEALLQAKGRALKSGVVMEGLGWLQLEANDSGAALASWRAARGYYKKDADCIRCALHAIGVLRATGKNAAALALTREQIKKYPQASAMARLKAIELELAPPPPPSPSAPGKQPAPSSRNR